MELLRLNVAPVEPLRTLHSPPEPKEDLCQASAHSPSLKYQNEGGPSPADIAELFRSSMPGRIAVDAIWRFADALIWNWLIAGTDAHAKNYSLLLSEDQVRLAPLYDIASALPYDIHETKLKFAMKIGGDYQVSPIRNKWPEVARELGLDASALIDRVRAMAAIAPDVFVDAAKDTAVVALDRPLPSRLADLVANRSVRCARTVEDGAETI